MPIICSLDLVQVLSEDTTKTTCLPLFRKLTGLESIFKLILIVRGFPAHHLDTAYTPFHPTAGGFALREMLLDAWACGGVCSWRKTRHSFFTYVAVHQVNIQVFEEIGRAHV